MRQTNYSLYVLPLFLLSALLLVVLPANSQGMKGVPAPLNSHQLFDPPPLIEGKSDNERWQKFLAIEKELLGMSYESVVERLAPCHSDKEKLKIQYQLTETKMPSAPGKLAHTDILIKLDNNNKVYSFSVEAVHWST